MFLEKSYITTKPKRNLCDRLLGWNRFYFYHVIINKFLRAMGYSYRQGGCSIDDLLYNSTAIRKFMESCGARFNISGLENISKVVGPVVFIGNHMSLIETLLLPGIIMPNKNITYVLKEELLTLPVLKDPLHMMECIGLTRKDPRSDLKTMFTGAQKAYEKGQSIIVFPQSTRSAEFIPEQFTTAGIKMAKKLGVQVIPIALKTDVCPKGKLIKDFGAIKLKNTVCFEFGEPITVEGNGKEAHQAVIDFIQKKTDNWKVNNYDQD